MWAEKLAVLGIGEGSRSQCNDVFRCGYSLCEWDECGGVSYGAVPQPAGDTGCALVRQLTVLMCIVRGLFGGYYISDSVNML